MSPLSLPVPYLLVRAAAALDAQSWEWRGLDDFIHWAETGLRISVSCCTRIHPDTRRHYGWIRHRIAFDPHTGTSHLVAQAPSEVEKVAARHTLWTLSHSLDSPPACERFAPVLADWVGPVHPGPQAPWARETADRMLALRTVLRGVQYLDTGLGVQVSDGHPNLRWLAMGAPPEVVFSTRTLLAEVGHARDEARVLGKVEHKVGLGRHPLKPGQRAVTNTGWMHSVIAEFVGHQFGVSDERIEELFGAWR